MLSIEQNFIINDIGNKNKCKVCSGKGTVELFRHDLEEFEEIDCEFCKK